MSVAETVANRVKLQPAPRDGATSALSPTAWAAGELLSDLMPVAAVDDPGATSAVWKPGAPDTSATTGNRKPSAGGMGKSHGQRSGWPGSQAAVLDARTPHGTGNGPTNGDGSRSPRPPATNEARARAILGVIGRSRNRALGGATPRSGNRGAARHAGGCTAPAPSPS